LATPDDGPVLVEDGEDNEVIGLEVLDLFSAVFGLGQLDHEVLLTTNTAKKKDLAHRDQY